MRSLRRRISPEYRQKASLAAARHFCESAFFQSPLQVGCYLAAGDEIGTTPLLQALWQAGNTCYLPKVSPPFEEKKLRFARYEEGTRLVLNRYQIGEPQGVNALVSGEDLDIAVLPLLAFDGQGNRLGSGGGYYDRTFEFLLRQEKGPQKKPRLLGLAYAMQQIEAVPWENFDVALDAVVTENGVMVFERDGRPS